MPELHLTDFDAILEKNNAVAPSGPRMVCVLLLDTSSSMSGNPIASLNKDINGFKALTTLDEIAQIDVAIIEFNSSSHVVQDFVPLPKMEPVSLSASGLSAMGAGINLAIDKIRERNKLYAAMGIPCFGSWILMITGGAPTDDILSARQRLIDEESKRQYGMLEFWAVGIPGHDKKTLTSLTKSYIALDEAKFDEILILLIERMVNISDRIDDDSPVLSELTDDAWDSPDEWW